MPVLYAVFHNVYANYVKCCLSMRYCRMCLDTSTACTVLITAKIRQRWKITSDFCLKKC